MRALKTILLILLALAAAAQAQDPRGTISGRVTDATGAALPGVDLRITKMDTGVTAATVTNDAGLFTVPFLPAGQYRVSAELAGFKKYVQENVQVRVSETTELSLRLDIGELSESVVVSGEAPLMDTSGASLGQVIDQRRVLELPMLAGNPMEPTLLTPGVINGTDMRLRKASANNGLSQIATDGNGLKHNEFQIDGVSNTYAEGSGAARVAFSPPANAVREFKIQTSPYDASTGHTTGALVNVSTAGGTNELHGEMHYWARNSAFDAANFFNNKNGTRPAVYQDHRYGASAGGPIYLPRLYRGHDRTFWYYAWESNQWGVPQTFTGTVPTAAERRGDFSELLRLGSRYQIYDPATTQPSPGGRFSRQPLSGNRIPAERLDPVGLALIALYPLPNRPGTADGRNNFFSAPKALEDYYVHLVRIDHAFSPSHRMFVRLHYDFWEEHKNDWFGNRTNAIVLNRINRGLALDDVLVLSPTLALNLRYGVTSQDFPERRATRFNRLVAGFAFEQPNPIEAAARAQYARQPIPELPPEDFRVRGGLTFVSADGRGRSPLRGEKNNFMPRVGLAYRLTQRTVVRAGYGMFYDTLGVNGLAPIQIGFSQATPIQASLDNGLSFVATTADPFPQGLRAPRGAAGGLTTNLGQALSFYRRDRRHPYAQRWSLGLQQVLPREFLVEATYVGNRGTRLSATRHLNSTPARFLSTRPVRDQATIDFLSEQVASPLFGLEPIYAARISRANLLRPFPEFGDITVDDPVGYSWYHALQVRGERRFSQGFTFQLAYAWSKLMEAIEFLNPTDPVPYRVIGSLDRPHRLAMSGLWEIPLGRGRRFAAHLPRWLDQVLGGWQIGGVAVRQSGAPLGFGNRIFVGDLKAIALPASQRTADRWFNTEAGFNRNTGEQLEFNLRTFPLRLSGVRGDGQSRWDFSAIKNFRLREQLVLQLRAEVYNAWNQTNFANPNTDPTSTTFGRITNTTSDARNWQFALKVTF